MNEVLKAIYHAVPMWIWMIAALVMYIGIFTVSLVLIINIFKCFFDEGDDENGNGKDKL